MPVQGSQNANAGEQCRATALDHQQQSFHRGPPLQRVVLFLRQRRNVLAGIPQRHQVAADDLDRFCERPPQARCVILAALLERRSS